MAKFPLYQWKKAGEGSSSIDTQNFASKIKANTFTQKNVFKNTGDVLTIQRTDDQSFGIDFKNENGERLGYIGTSQNEAAKTTVWGLEGLILQTTNKDINMNSGTAQLLYNSTSNLKNRREVLCRNDLYYIRKINNNGFTINANSTQTVEFTVNGLSVGLNEFYVVLTTSNIDIGFDVKIQCNNLNYRNMSDIKTISTTNWQSNDIDSSGLIQIGLIQYGNNKIRFRAKNLHNQNITFNGFRVYHRIPGKLADN